MTFPRFLLSNSGDEKRKTMGEKTQKNIRAEGIGVRRRPCAWNAKKRPHGCKKRTEGKKGTKD